jgi:hypothetical protein
MHTPIGKQNFADAHGLGQCFVGAQYDFCVIVLVVAVYVVNQAILRHERIAMHCVVKVPELGVGDDVLRNPLNMIVEHPANKAVPYCAVVHVESFKLKSSIFAVLMPGWSRIH